MVIRVATFDDIETMRVIRASVAENRLIDPRRATPEKYREMLGIRGKGWVCESEGRIVAFGIADAASRSLWALFVKPGFERLGFGRALHNAMVAWLFEVAATPIWLSTGPDTRAARFYAAAGWRPEKPLDNGELCFSRAR
ncbi:MAG: GNAT family N-acetyltransferase [Gammaproteobacteria bacterium]